jgi:hypothetical protein
MGEVLTQIQSKVVCVGNFQLLHLLCVSTDLGYSGFYWIFSLHESFILVLNFINNSSCVEVAFPLSPVDWLKIIRNRCFTLSPVLEEGLLRYSKTVESWPSLSLDSLLFAVNLSLCNHLLVKSLSIIKRSKWKYSTLLGVVDNSSLAWLSSGSHCCACALEEGLTKLLS